MFWGLILKPNRKYSQITSKSFHISQAALDGGNACKIYLTHENQKFLICSLNENTFPQVMLDLNFSEGDDICFQSVGSGNVTLSGYVIQDFQESDDADSDLSDHVEDARDVLNRKALVKKVKKSLYEHSNQNDEENKDETALLEQDDDSDEDDDGNSSAEDSDEEEASEAEESEEEVQQPKAKQPKLEKAQNGVAEKKEMVDKKGKDKKGKKEKQQQVQQKTGGERVLTGGVKIEDIRVGSGPEAKSGKRAAVYYEGRLKSNNKVFDSLKQGAGFKFGIGRGEVIKGWEIGVTGMKVGGKRRITCPPHMAYGARGSPPTIPPNSTLVFELELKGVN